MPLQGYVAVFLIEFNVALKSHFFMTVNAPCSQLYKDVCSMLFIFGGFKNLLQVFIMLHKREIFTKQCISYLFFLTGRSKFQNLRSKVNLESDTSGK